MEKINELVNLPEEEIGLERKNFLTIHNSILYYGNNVCFNLYQMAKRLEEMKNTKAYLSAGFETFEHYVEDALGIKRSQAYNYIKIANSYSNEFIINNSKIGVTKLLVLSDLEEPVVEKVIETVQVEDTKVTELKELVKKLKNENKDLKKNNKELLQINQEHLKETSEETVEDSNNEELVKKIKELEVEISNKNKEIKIKDNELINIKKESKSNIINSNPALIEFKVKFEELQVLLKTFNHIIVTLNEDEKNKCKKALNMVLRESMYE